MNAAVLSLIAFVSVIVVQAARRISGRPAAERISPVVSGLGAVLLFYVLVSRSVSIGFPALTNTFEVLLLLSGLLALIVSVYRFLVRDPTSETVSLWGLAVALVLLVLASSPLVPAAAKPPIPALRSHWLLLHVGLSIAGEAFFAVGFVTALLELCARDHARQKRLDRLTYTAIAVGYPLFTAGALLFGAVWAQAAWGRYWSWDPKETWALVTWLVYTAYLHLRLIAGRSGKAPAVVAVAAFLVALFTFFGVNYLLGGLHSYR